MRRDQGKGEKGHPGQESCQEQELDVHVANSSERKLEGRCVRNLREQ